MFKLFLPFLLISIFAFNTYSQHNIYDGSYQCWMKKINGPQVMNPGQQSPNSPKHKFDVLNYTINVDIRHCFISPFPKNFAGNVVIKFRIDTALNQIDLNAVNTSLQINSVGLSGTSFTHSNNQLLVNLNRVYTPGETASVSINYQHLNVADQAFYTSNGMVFTDAPPEGARKWFPCYDKPGDKATVELTAKVPANSKLGSNGKLIDSTVTGDSIYYHWKSRDPIATYLINMSAKVNYNLDIMYWHRPSNPVDSVPVRFYYNAGENPGPVKNVTIDMMNYFSQKFGEYPFEKNGYATLNSQFQWGGMENQTLISLCQNCWQVSLVSHEFAHQWFGDMITCGTWADVWLNEGFGTYLEAIWLEHTGGYAAYKNRVNSHANSYLSGNPGWPMYNPEWAINTPSINVLYNYAITYAKGSGVLHMLRYVLGDSVFFNCIKAYAMDSVNFKNQSAVTDDFTAKLSQVAGQDLSWFINNWVKQPNHPVYQNLFEITPSGSNWNVHFITNQTQTNSPFHPMPLTLKITFNSGPDTTMRVMNDQNGQIYDFLFSRQPVNVIFDPNNDIVLKNATTSYIGIEEIGTENPNVYMLYQNYPNPFNPVTRITYDVAELSNVEIKIYNEIGQLIKTLVNEMHTPGKYAVIFDGSRYSSGIYFYKMKSGKYTSVSKMILIK